MSKFDAKAMFSYDKNDHTEDSYKKPCKYKMCYVDADTILHSAAISLQQGYINVKHIKSGRVKRFENITAFKGRSRKTLGGWLKETNDKQEASGKPIFTLEDFEIENMVEIKPEFKSTEEAIEYGLSSIGYAVGGLKKKMDSEDYRLIISGGKGNYRNDHAKTLKYKGERSDKPILYLELKEAMIEQYNKRMMFADFCEAEDVCGWYANKEWERTKGKLDDYEICIAYVDKDLNMIKAPSFNYQKLEEDWRIPTELECNKWLVTQIVCGDKSCDNIEGLPNLPLEVTEKFGLRKANGCGKQTAINLLETAETEKEMWERAVFAYQSYYGMEPVKFKSWDGEELEWTWLDFMQETAVLVKMQEFEGHIINVGEILDEFEIDYSKKLFPSPKKVFRSDVEEEVVGVNESLLQLLATQLSSYKSLKKADLVDKLDDIKDCLTDITSNFDEAFYEMKQEGK